MSDTNARIEQFQKMAGDDPDNELGHFSLGREYLTAGRWADAVASLERALSINPNLSKAYQLVGQALLQQNQRDAAVARLTAGVTKADERGDVMPRTEMVKMLEELGAPLPELKARQEAKPVGEGEVLCKRCGKIGPKMSRQPFRNEFGQQIFANTCATCWQEAIRQGTKVINELRLPLNDPQAQTMWDQHIKEFLNL